MAKSTSKANRKRYLLPPCPAYDIEGMESWLSDQACTGWFLCPEGFLLGVATFEAREPTAVRYRLEPAPVGRNPDTEARQLNASFGWEYVATRGKFDIYCTADRAARELNTDPQVQALALDVVRKKERLALIQTAFWLILYPLLYMRRTPLLTALSASSGILLLTMGLAALILYLSITRVVHLYRVRQRLMRGHTLNHHKRWHVRAWAYHARSVLLASMLLVLGGWMLGTGGGHAALKDRLSLSTYQGDPPFATIADWIPGGEYAPVSMGGANTFRQRTHWLAPLILDWKEFATIRSPASVTLTLGLYADYYDLRTPGLARQLVREMKRADGIKQKTLPLVLSGLPTDEAFAYQNEMRMTVILLRQETRVLHALIIQSEAAGQLPIASIAQALADRMQSQGDASTGDASTGVASTGDASTGGTST